jgi:hypothetical protein
MKPKFIVKIQMFSGNHYDSSQFLNAVSYVVIFNKLSRVFVEQKYKSVFLPYARAHLPKLVFGSRVRV